MHHVVLHVHCLQLLFVKQEIFDPSVKKKKKKKTSFDPDAFGDVDQPKDSAATDSMSAADAMSEEKSVAQG